MSALVEKLTAEGSGEPAGWLNELVANLWPNINVAGSKMVKEVVEPMFKTMLPGPLSSLHFTKIDFGTIPFKFSNVSVTKIDDLGGIKLDLNVDWEGKCDIELDGGAMVPAIGVESVELYGRLSVLLCPLTNVIPLIGAAQISFINPPVLKLDFTGAANVADFSAIDGAVRNTILGVINSMLTLPNRYLVKLDTNNDYFKTYLYPLGIIRVTVEKAWGYAEEAKGSMKKLFSKVTRAEPDCFTKVEVGAEEAWQTSTKNNTTHPSWNETHDFVVSDYNQCIRFGLEDHDVNSNDEIGMGVTTVKEILLAGGRQELALTKENQETEGRVSVTAEYFQLSTDESSFTASQHKGDGRLCGLVNVLVAGASNIKGQRQDLTPSVVVSWGKEHRFQTAVKTDAPGTDISNPGFDQSFRFPVTLDMVGSKAQNIRLALNNGEQEIGAAEIAYADLLKAPDMILADNFGVGNGASVRASFCLRGLKGHTLQQSDLPDRSRK